MLSQALSRRISWFLFGGGFLLAGSGFIVEHMWTMIPWGPAGLLAALGFGSLVFAWVVSRVFHIAPATAAAAIWLAALAYFVGMAPLAAVLLLAMAALASGSLLVPAGWAARVPLSILTGLALIAGFDGWLLPYPLHRHASYLLVLLLISLVRRAQLWALIKPLPRAWTETVSVVPWTATLAIVALGTVSTCAWTPTMHFDDLAYHLRLPYQLGALGYYRMDAASQVWAVAPWAGDVLQGIAQLLAGGEARGAVDAMWLLLALCCLWSLCESLMPGHRMRWLALALFVSLPLTADALASMQTEGATAAVAAGLALLIQRKPGTPARLLLVAAVLFGLLLGLKVSNVMIGGSLGLWLLWEWRARLAWRVLPLAAMLAFGVAGSSYIYAYVLTGNPVLPLFNSYFHSPYYSFTDFHDTNWAAGLHWRTLWDITFHTGRYLESGDGAAGFILLALLGSLLVAIVNRRTRPLALAASVAFVLPLSQIQYLRYAHPAMVLLVPAMLCGVPRMGASGWLRSVSGVLLVVLLAGDLAFVASGDWQLQQGVLRALLTRGRVATLDTFVPTYRVVEFIEARYGDQARTLLLDARYPFVARLAGNAFVTAWYDSQNASAAITAEAARDASGWQAMFQNTGVNLLVLQQTEHTQTLDAAIAEDQGARIYQAGEWEVWALHAGKPATPLPAPAGSVIVKFDVDNAPVKATLLNAQLTLQCRGSDTPIVIAWDATEAGNAHWHSDQWAKCLGTGVSEASVAAALPQKITAFTVTATPAKPVNMHLRLLAASADLRPDLVMDRDLARHWRRALIDEVKLWNRARVARRRAAR